MATSLWHLRDNVFPQDAGRMIRPTDAHVTYAGPSGLAVWRDPGETIITTAREMREHTSVQSAFGREALRLDPDTRFWNSNDVQKGEITFKTDWTPGQDRDGDGRDADTFVFRFADLADVDTKPDNRPGHHGETGVDLWFNDRRVHIAPQANGEIDVFAVRTDADSIVLAWDSGTDARPDGFNLLQPCTAVPVDAHIL